MLRFCILLALSLDVLEGLAVGAVLCGFPVPVGTGNRARRVISSQRAIDSKSKKNDLARPPPCGALSRLFFVLQKAR